MRIVIKHTAALAALLAAVSSCTSQAQTRWYQDQTAKHVACVPEQIHIKDADESHWTATCRSQTYYCSKARSSADEPVPPVEEGSVSCAALK